MEEIDLKRLCKTAFAVKWYIVIIMIISIILGIIYSFLYKVPEYKSTATIVLTQATSDANSGTTNSITTTDITMNKSLVETYSDIVKSKAVLSQVISNLGLNISEDALSESIIVTSKDTAAILYVAVVNQDAEFAKQVTNEVTKVFSEKVKDLYNINNVNILDYAEKEEQPYNVNHIKDLIIFAMIGVFLSGGLVLIVYMLDTTVKQEEDIEESVGIPVIGILPVDEEENDRRTEKNTKSKNKLKKEDVKLLENTKTHSNEAFRTLRTNLIFAQKNKNIKTILVTSSYSGEGKSYVSSNLAIALARSNKKVLIIDADMRKGRQNSIFKVSNSKGLSNALLELRNMNVDILSKYIKITNIPNLHIITAGDRPANPSELISSQKMAKMISMLNDIYDLVVIDGTPSALVADSIALSKFVDSVLIVTAYKLTKIDNVQKMKKMFENVGAQITGAVINKFPIEESAFGEKYYYSDDKNEKTEYNKDERIKSVREVIEESKLSKNSSYKDEDKDDSFDDNKSDFTISNEESLVPENSNYLQFKMENINQEINAIKNLFLQYMINSSPVSKEEFLELKQEIENLKTVIENKNSDETKEMKEEIEAIRNITSEMIQKQENNSTNVKNFIEAFRNRNNL